MAITSKTYEIRYVGYKEQSKRAKLVGYLRIKTVYNCDNGKQVSSSSGSGSVVKTAEDTAKISAAVAKAMSEVAAQNKGDKVESNTASDGNTTTTYHSNKK